MGAWGKWLNGVVSAAAGGAASAVATAAVSPEILTAPGGLKKLGAIGLVGAGTACLMHLRQSPLPIGGDQGK